MKGAGTSILLIIAFLVLSLSGCQDGLFGGRGENEDVQPRGTECRSSYQCKTGASCNNGYCECPDTMSQLRPGFCIRRELPNTFVTFDQHPEWVDTTMISFNKDPFETDWSTVSDDRVALDGEQVYYSNRGTWGTVGRLFRPENTEVAADSIWIMPIETGNVRNSAYFNNLEWRCTKVFAGRFVDRDTIKGRMIFLGCVGPENSPLPDEVQNPTHEMTWVRLH